MDSFRQIVDEMDEESRQHFLRLQSRGAAISAALWVVACPMFLALFAWVITLTMQAISTDASTVVGGLIFGMAIFPSLAIFGGVFSGWLAHRVFWGSNIPVTRMAIANALIFDFAAFGWFLIILYN